MTRSAATTSTAITLAPADHAVDRWVADLRRIVIGGQVEVIAQVGEYLIANLYGSVEEALSRQPRKAVSLERLAERAEEFGMTAGGLTRAVPMALQVRALGRTLALRLGVRQHRALLPVKDAGAKKSLAQQAVEAGWTAEELRKKVRRVQQPHAGGRKKEPAVRAVVLRASRVLEATSATEIRDGIDGLAPAEAKRLLARVSAMTAALERIEKLLVRAATRG